MVTGLFYSLFLCTMYSSFHPDQNSALELGKYSKYLRGRRNRENLCLLKIFLHLRCFKMPFFVLSTNRNDSLGNIFPQGKESIHKDQFQFTKANLPKFLLQSLETWSMRERIPQRKNLTQSFISQGSELHSGETLAGFPW